ncbi:amino acid adenylation domain-containing protein [Streptacidiphilus rugosus]|uniref:amino acid adenylation domain-containing protein n=1 Tax=Streptacidiphilus rugosus TaxID=405783 RepID=UPI00068F5FEC|nr:amino acid adenylation domain-containing protein [Streptacidiphilus rugosus]
MTTEHAGPEEVQEPHHVLCDNGRHRAVWPAHLPVPDGWRVVDPVPRTAAECAAALAAGDHPPGVLAADAAPAADAEGPAPTQDRPQAAPAATAGTAVTAATSATTATTATGATSTASTTSPAVGTASGVATVSARVRARAFAAPHASALRWDGGELDYRTLDHDADRLAARLQDEAGIGRGDVVALCLDRTAGLVVAMLAVQRAGAAFLPLDPGAPSRRLVQLTADAGAALILTDRHHAAGLSGARSGQVRTVEDLVALPDRPDRPPPEDPDPDDLAYVIYTSGSSGPPKGVAVTHRSLSGSLAASADYYGLGPGDRVLHLAAVGFDTSLEQIFAPLTSGATVVLTESRPWAPTDLLRGVPEHGITVLDMTPAYWRRLLDILGPGQEHLASVRLVILGGEIIHTGDCHAFLRHFPGIRLVNAYGLTETTITSTTCDLTYELLATPTGAPAPVGRALPGGDVHVLDHQFRPVAPGERGEVYIGGSHLAEGVWRRPDLTALQFLPDPFAHTPGARMYRTGDTGRWRPDGNLEILGRIDEQVKIRGYRIDPGEIESVLRAQPGVRHAVVTVRQDRGDPELAAYYTLTDTPGSHARADGDRLRGALAEALPGYMVPTSFVALPQMPLTPNGKVDRKALPRSGPLLPTPSAGARPVDTPTATLHHSLAHLWALILGLPHVDAGDDFFELGGNSLLAMEMLARARVMFGIDVDQIRELTSSLLRHSTLAAFSERLRQARAGTLNDAERTEVDFAAESQLCLALHPGTGRPPVWQQPGDVLLTGATGLCGIHMLHDLVRHTDARIHCLVRAADADQAWERIRACHQRYHLDDLPAELRGERILPVVGDLGRPRFGLPADRFAELGDTVDLIYHFGGQVNFIFPYQNLRAVNVESVREMVRLAAPRRIPLHFTSTMAVLAGFGPVGRREVTEETPLDYADYLTVGYVETKWVAEAMLNEAAQAGVPMALYRLHDVTGPVGTGAVNTTTEICALIRFIADTGMSPDQEFPLDLLPADCFAGAVRHISTTRPARGQVYHLTNPEPALMSSLGECLRGQGYKVETVPYRTWVTALVEFAAAHPAHPVTPFVPLFVDRCARADLTVSEMYLYDVFPAFTRTNTEHALADSGLRIPPVDLPMLDRYVDFLLAEGYLQPPQGRSDGPGRVADPVSWPDLDLSHAPTTGPVAFGADLGPESLLAGYRAGAYPIPLPDPSARAAVQRANAPEAAAGGIPLLGPADAGDPWSVAWWSPDPRPVLDPTDVHLSHGLARRLRHRLPWTTTADHAFERVVRACRARREPLWLTDELIKSLVLLHDSGAAHSVEVWDEEGDLVGGVFGVRIGPVFSMDSMFSSLPGAGQVAVADLAQRFRQAGGTLLDAQWDSPHVRALGAALLPRERYLALLHVPGPGDAPIPTEVEPVRRLAPRRIA